MNKKDPDFLAFIIREISNYIFKLIKGFNIDPNKLTIFSFVIFVPLIFYSLIFNGVNMSILSFILLSGYTIVDMLDGNFARNQKFNNFEEIFVFKDQLNELNEEDNPKTQIEQTIPLKRYAEPIEIANLLLFLSGDESEFITGSVHMIDGGFTA